MICISPFAPADDLARGLAALSACMTAWIQAAGMPNRSRRLGNGVGIGVGRQPSAKPVRHCAEPRLEAAIRHGDKVHAGEGTEGRIGMHGISPSRRAWAGSSSAVTTPNLRHCRGTDSRGSAAAGRGSSINKSDVFARALAGAFPAGTDFRSVLVAEMDAKVRERSRRPVASAGTMVNSVSKERVRMRPVKPDVSRMNVTDLRP